MIGHRKDCRCMCCFHKTGKNHPFFGKHHSRESNLKNRASHLGRKLSKEHKIKIGLKSRGHTLSKKVREQISKKLKGHEVSEDRRRKISLACGGTGIPRELSEYGVEFDSVLKEKIRSRDRYKCRKCGRTQISNNRQLDVHHIDYDKYNNNSINLISLCKKCHMKTNFNRKHWKEYYYKKDKGIK